jgi:hypothetical protein
MPPLDFVPLRVTLSRLRSKEWMAGSSLANATPSSHFSHDQVTEDGMKITLSLALLCLVLIAGHSSASAEVRFGRNVYIGGHNFSHQRYGPNRRLMVKLYRGNPRNAGCRWYPAGARYAGRRLTASTRICHLQRR